MAAPRAPPRRRPRTQAASGAATGRAAGGQMAELASGPKGLEHGRSPLLKGDWAAPQSASRPGPGTTWPAARARGPLG